MRFNIIISLYVVSLSFCLDLRPIESIENWDSIQSGNITVDWVTYEGYPISRAQTILHHPMDEIAYLIQDLKSYPTIFKRVSKTKQLESDIIQIVLDMPFPFDGRDYIVKYHIKKLEDNWVFWFSSVKHPEGTLGPNHIRLPNAAGIWILKELKKGKTEVTYAWNGELLGNFPDVALHRAWKTQGTEVLGWLDQALYKKNNP